MIKLGLPPIRQLSCPAEVATLASCHCVIRPRLTSDSDELKSVSLSVYANSQHVVSRESVTVQCAAKKVSHKVFCHFLGNQWEFLYEISHIYYSFIVT